jgi:hypothetical protein
MSYLLNDDLTTRLENWGRWARQRSHHLYVRCGSAEKKWKSPQVHDERNPFDDRDWPISIDVLDAQAIEDAWQTLPWVPKEILKGKYVWVSWYKATCRAIGIHPRGYGDHLHHARMMLSRRLGVKFLRNAA